MIRIIASLLSLTEALKLIVQTSFSHFITNFAWFGSIMMRRIGR